MSGFKRILVPLDGSSLAERALAIATTLATQFDSEIILMRVIDFHDPRDISALPDVIPSTAMIAAYDHASFEANCYLQGRQLELGQRGIVANIQVDNDDPAEKIIDFAQTESVDLIVMSTHGRSGLSRWAFGSVADKVMRHASCPVLIVRRDDKPESHNGTTVKQAKTAAIEVTPE